MSHTSKKIPQILLMRDYYPIDRAARLLGCEVGDLLHWGAIGAIELCASLDGENGLVFITDGGRMERTTKYYDFGVDKYIVNDKASYEITEDHFDDVFAGFLTGFWALDSRCLDTMERYPRTSQSLWFKAKDQNDRDVLAVTYDKATPIMHGIECDDKSQINESENKFTMGNLWIMRKDFEIAQSHLRNGAPFPIHAGGIDRTAMANMVTVAENKKLRTTTNQCKTIAELLIAHGFTDEDFKGSIDAMQQKIARKGLSKTLANVDNKTLTDWLFKADKR